MRKVAPAPAAAQELPLRRVIGRVTGAQPGPTLLCVAGLHGNEPAGVLALERVFAELARQPVRLRGRFVGLAGNLAGLRAGRRYLARDLNRQWGAEQIADLRGRPLHTLDPEAHEQVALLGEIEAVFASAAGPVFVADLHTTSGTGAPFVTLSDTLPNRALARSFPIPIILGIEEQLEGTLPEFVGTLGAVAVGVEGGEHRDPASVDHLEAAVWIALEAAGLLPAERRGRLEAARQVLARAAQGLPAFVEIRYRHAVEPESGFRMEPGFVNFQPIVRGQLLAREHRGAIHAPESGRILMPLYQQLGSDGFFVVREVRPFWLGASAVLRRLGAERVAPLLPGVRRHPELPDTVIVNRRIARWYTVEIFHLLGFRRERVEGDTLVMSRRQGDNPHDWRRGGR